MEDQDITDHHKNFHLQNKHLVQMEILTQCARTGCQTYGAIKVS